MHDALRDALVVEVRDLLAQDEIFEQRRAAIESTERILIVDHRDTLVVVRGGCPPPAIWCSSPAFPALWPDVPFDPRTWGVLRARFLTAIWHLLREEWASVPARLKNPPAFAARSMHPITKEKSSSSCANGCPEGSRRESMNWGSGRRRIRASTPGCATHHRRAGRPPARAINGKGRRSC
jgi:hypothetical protein